MVLAGGVAAACSGLGSAAEASPPDDDFITVAGRRFAVLGTARNIRRSGDWFDMTSYPGDRPQGERTTAVRRVGLDGWPDPFPANDSRVQTLFDLELGEGALARAAGNWLIPFELHARTLPGDGRSPAGPLGLSVEWSAGLRRCRLRVWRREWGGRSFMDADLPVAANRLYRFRIDHRVHATDGLLRVEMNGERISDHRGPFGYGRQRALYPQFRLYSDERQGTMRARLRPASFEILEGSGVEE